MKKKIKYTDEPMEFEVVKDFLPSPEQIALKSENVKVTISLSSCLSLQGILSTRGVFDLPPPVAFCHIYPAETHSGNRLL